MVNYAIIVLPQPDRIRARVWNFLDIEVNKCEYNNAWYDWRTATRKMISMWEMRTIEWEEMLQKLK